MARIAKRFLFVPVAALVLFSAGCSRDSREAASTPAAPARAPEPVKKGTAMVRVVNAVPGGVVLDTWAGETKAFSKVAFRTATAYRELPEERVTFRVRPTGKDAVEPLAENSEGLDNGKHYTVVAMPTNDGATLRVYDDDTKPPDAGKAKIRIINATNDAGDIDVMLKGKEDSWFRGLGLMRAGYNDVSPADGPVRITVEGKNEAKKDVKYTVASAPIQAGKAYTIVLVGNRKGKVDAIRIEDNFEHTMAGSSATPERKRSAY